MSRRQPSRRDFFNEGQRPEQRYDPETGRPAMYHGTGHDIVAGKIIPRNQLWHGSQWDSGFYSEPAEAWRKDRVFASTGERAAWQWAQGPGRHRVHEVHVDDPRGGSHGEFHGKSATVKDTHWIPPPTMYRPNAWVQGTLPPENWGHGKNWRHHDPDDMDEPEPEQPNLQPKQFAGQGRLFE